MTTKRENFDVIIVGGSYAGLSAGLALGRALRKVLIIDSGLPCNRQTPHSHNFLTQDGSPPGDITARALSQLEKYDTIQFCSGLAVSGTKREAGFEITLQTGKMYQAKKVIFATGITDQTPNIEGFAACWGKSVLHCPYCHGYEYRQQATGIWANGDIGFEFSRLISNWTNQLTLFTNGPSTLNPEQRAKLAQHGINMVEKEVASLDHTQGYLQHVVLRDGSKIDVQALYARVPFIQHSDIPAKLGCELTEQGLLKVDPFQQTTVQGVYACGDNASPLRSVANAVANGNVAGAVANKELIEDRF